MAYWFYCDLCPWKEQNRFNYTYLFTSKLLQMVQTVIIITYPIPIVRSVSEFINETTKIKCGWWTVNSNRWKWRAGDRKLYQMVDVCLRVMYCVARNENPFEEKRLALKSYICLWTLLITHIHQFVHVWRMP